MEKLNMEMTLADWTEVFEKENQGMKAREKDGIGAYFTKEFIKWLSNKLSNKLPSRD